MTNTESASKIDSALLIDPAAATALVDRVWETEIVPALIEYIAIPNKSPMFDADWEAHGHMERAVELISNWCRGRPVPGLTLEIIRLEGRTPLIYMEVPGTGEDTVLLYGHLDKQPEMAGWREDLAPWKPVLEGDKLYGRGGADDGYAAFASLTALQVLADQGVPHARCVILIEASEESGSPDLPAYIEHLGERLGTPSLVVCLDSGCGDYERLWGTTSLRGMAAGDLRVEMLAEGVHSGDASGIVPDSWRVLARVLARLEDVESGRVLPAAFHAEIPSGRVAEAGAAAEILGDAVPGKYPFLDGVCPIDAPLEELVLNRTWRPALSVTGAEGLPALADAGNVCRPFTAVKLSLRLPPTVDGDVATLELKRLLEADPPYGARVTFEPEAAASGWDAPPTAAWLGDAVQRASRTFFGPAAGAMGEGGTIPFMAMLGDAFPEAQFLITGVLGPKSNAHGPNEFLHLPTGRRLTSSVASVLADHLVRDSG